MGGQLAEGGLSTVDPTTSHHIEVDVGQNLERLGVDFKGTNCIQNQSNVVDFGISPSAGYCSEMHSIIFQSVCALLGPRELHFSAVNDQNSSDTSATNNIHQEPPVLALHPPTESTATLLSESLK